MRMRQTIRVLSFRRHVHSEAYAALVLAGGYEEAGDRGRFVAKAGDVIFHDRFEAHADHFSENGATLLNLPLRCCHDFVAGMASVADPDLIVRLAEKNKQDAVACLVATAVCSSPQSADWTDLLANDLARNPSVKLSAWCEKNSLAPWTISRGFALVFGISPEAFRARTRARHAWTLINRSSKPLADIAAELGFADQPHMTRSVKQLTGVGPRAWRLSANRFKTQPPAKA